MKSTAPPLAYQKEVDARERIIVGVNSFMEPEKRGVSILKVKDAGREKTGAETSPKKEKP